MQRENNLPSIMLRMKLSKDQTTAAELESLECKTPMYNSVKEMCKPIYFINTKKNKMEITHSTEIIISNQSSKMDKQIKLLKVSDLFESNKWKESGKYSFNNVEIFTKDDEISYRDILINLLGNQYLIESILLQINISTSNKNRLEQLENTEWFVKGVAPFLGVKTNIPFYVVKLLVDDRAKKMKVPPEYIHPNYYKSRVIQGGFYTILNSENFVDCTIKACTEISVSFIFAENKK